MAASKSVVLTAGLAAVIAAKASASGRAGAASRPVEGEVVAEADHLSFRIPRPVNGRDGLNGLDGKDGTDGRDGKDGEQGPPGRPGAPGRDGKDGEPGPMPDHEWDGTKLRLQKPSGDWGQPVDLKGKDGERGPRGPSAGASSSGSPDTDLSATFTTGGAGLVERIDYEDGSYKNLTYEDGLLVQVDHVSSGVTRRSTFTYGPDGGFLSVVKTRV